MTNNNFTKALTGALLLSTLAGGSAFAQERTLRLATDQPKGHPYDMGAEEFARLVSEKTNGEIAVEIYPAAQLGDSAEQVEGLHIGALDMTLSSFSHASQFCADLSIFGAPFLFETEEHFAAVFDGEIGDELAQSCAETYSIRLLNTFTSGYRLLFNGARPIESIGDLDGLKIRVQSGRADALTWKVFGAIPAPIPYSEVYSALQAGVIDGAENEPASILANRFYEAAPYLTNTKHLVVPMGLFISDRVFSDLSTENQTALQEAADEAATYERNLIVELNAAAIEEMTTNFGVTVTEVDVDAMRDKGQEVQALVAQELGQQDMLEKIRAAAQ
jgi:tripartite ATP-independent transporter DctP family solute receptor